MSNHGGILGLDLAMRSSGWAISYGRTGKEVISGSIKCKAKRVYECASEAQDQLSKVLGHYPEISLCVLEAPFRGTVGNVATVADLNLVWGQMCGEVRSKGIPCIAIPPATWRNVMYGFGRKPGWQTKHWKAHAKQTCEAEYKLSPRNSDEAEAIIISQYGFYTQTWKMRTQAAIEVAHG